MEEISGLKKHQVKGKSIFNLFAYDSITQKDHFNQTISGYNTRFHDAEYKIPGSGKKGYFDAQFSPLYDNNGKICGGLAIIHETSKRKKAEKELRQKNELLIEAQEIGAIGNWFFDAERKESYWSEQVYKLFGKDKIDRQDTFGILKEHVFPADLEIIQKLAEKAMIEGVPYQSQYRITRSDGSIRMIGTHARPVKDSDGNISGLKGICQDITDRWTAEEKLKESGFLIRQIADASPHLIYVYDLNNKKNIYANAAVSQVLGFQAGELKEAGSNLRNDIIFFEDLEALIAKFREMKAAKDGDIIETEHRIKDRYGRTHWLLSRGAVFKRNLDGTASQILITATDITDRKKAEEKLLQSSHFIEKITQTTPNLLYVFDLTDNINIYVNRSIENYLGYNSKQIREMHTTPMENLIYPGDLPFVLQHLKSLKNLKDGESLEIEYRMKHSNNKWYWFHIVDAVFNRDEKGKPSLIVMSLLDINDKKSAEQQVVLREMQLNEAQKIAHLGSWEWDVKTDFIYFSDEMYRIFEYEPFEIDINFEKFKGHLHSEDKQFVITSINESLLTKAEFGFQHRIITKSGNIKWLFTSGKANLIKGSEIYKINGVAFNITERIESEIALKQLNNELEERVKRRTKQLEESAAKFLSVIEAIPAIAWTSLMDGSITYVNKAWNDFVGDTSIAETLEKHIYHEDIERTKIKWADSLKTGELFDLEFRWVRQDQNVRWMLGRANPIRNLEGEIILWIGTATDIHDQKTIHEKLKNTQYKLNKINFEISNKNEELLRTNSDLDNFIYTASHDLRAPISNIEGLVQNLSEEIKNFQNVEIEAIINMIGMSIERFKETIKDLTEITKIQKNIQDDDSGELIDISEILEDVKFNLNKIIRETMPEINTKLEVNTFGFSKKNLRSILYNLVSNAIKYSSPDRKCKILIETKELPEHILLSVKDNGLGIREDQKHKVFSMFKRLHDHVEGTGVGLYIVKRMIDNAGGRIELESTVNKGSEFRVFLKKNL